MELEQYELKQNTEAILRERGSRFLAYAYVVRSESEIALKLNHLKETHPQASHVCYAWVLDQPDLHYRHSDDGEPANSAGTPIYRQLLSHKLLYTLVAVVRYFGGKKLGVSGLISAYGLAAEKAIQAAGRTQYVPKYYYKLLYNKEKHYKLYELSNMLEFNIIENDPDHGTSVISREGHEMPPLIEIPKHYAIFDIKLLKST